MGFDARHTGRGEYGEGRQGLRTRPGFSDETVIE